MSKKSKEKLEKLKVKFENDIKEEIKFYKKPESLILLTTSAISSLDVLNLSIKKSISKIPIDIDDLSGLKKFLRNNSDTNLILKKSETILNEDILSSILLKCDNVNEENIEDFIKATSLSEDFTQINENITTAEIGVKINEYVDVALIVYYMSKLLINTLSNSRFPSNFRLKYIQKLAKITIASIAQKLGQKFKNLSGFINIIINITITITASTAIYLFNVKQLKSQANSILSENMCGELSPAFDVDISSNTFEISLECPVEFDQVMVPKQPFENKENNFSCEIPENIETVIEAKIKNDLATKAIIVNNRKENMNLLVTKDSYVTDKTIISTVGEFSIYSPVNGYVSDIKENKITLKNISESSDNYLSESILELNEKYEELNNIKTFLKKYEIKSLYPIMIKTSPSIDTSLNTTFILSNGMYKPFKKIKNDWVDELEIYEKNIQKIAGEDNIKINAENETLFNIKDEIDNQEKITNDSLTKLIIKSSIIAKNTKVKNIEFELLEYFLIEVLLELTTTKTLNNIEQKFKDQINIFTQQRYVIDGAKPKIIIKKINEFILNYTILSKGNWFKTGLKLYQTSKKLSNIENWLKSIETNDDDFSKFDKEILLNKIMFLYKFYFQINHIVEKYKNLKEANKKDQVVKEGNYVSNYFGQLRKRFKLLPLEIKDIESRIENLALLPIFSIIKENEEEFRKYSISASENKCPRPNKNPNLGGKTETDFGDIKYWLKYCSFATLASVVSPDNGWSTGLILPGAVIKLPVIYLPIKAISTPYGFMMLGLTIVGIWFTPIILMVNYETKSITPFVDPVAFIKKQIDTLKENISVEIKTLKIDNLKKYLDNIKKEINNKILGINKLSELIKIHKLSRPSKLKKNIIEQEKWNLKNINLSKEKLLIKTDKWKLEKKFMIIYNSYKLGTNINENLGDPIISSIQQIEKNINNQLNKINDLLEKIEKTIEPLPITLKPNTANFGFTIKNPKPIINILSDIDDNINNNILENIQEKFKLNNEKLMSKEININYEKYLNIIKTKLPIIIKKEPFPAYESLSPINFTWLKFLKNEFVPTGAKTYGIPGFSPFP